MPRVKMHHPAVGIMECSAAAVTVHQRNGWRPVEGAHTVTVAAADGSPLTTGTVFPPETFDDDEPDSTVESASEPGAEASTTTRARKGTTTPTKEA